MATTTAPARKKVVIIGGGLQGCATAYYLKERADVDITIIERTEIAAAASGKGGGFLARDWGRGPTKALHELSFDLHAELAEQLGVSSYRKISTLEVRGELGLREWPPKHVTAKPIKTSPLHPDWLDRTDTKSTLLDQNTAQVAPKELCEKLFEASGATLKRGAARGLEIRARDSSSSSSSSQGGRKTKHTVVVGVRVEKYTDDDDDDADVGGKKREEKKDASSSTEVVPCDEVVVALGAWSVLLEDWLPGFTLPMEGVYSSSMVYEAGPEAIKEQPFALFCAEDSNHCHLEVYPRPDGSVYLCGIGGSDHVRGARLREGGDLQDASKMAANPGRINAATLSLEKLAPAFAFLNDAPKTAACMRPCAPDALPVIGRLDDDDDDLPTNVVLATGHNCWGILWAPITGKIVADIILKNDNSAVADISAFSPKRFMQKASNKRGRAKDDYSLGEQW